MKIGKQTYKINSKPCIFATSSIVGPKEMQGPLANYFELHINDVFFDEKTFEKAESKMLESCIRNLLVKTGTNEQDIDVIFSGDLLNQCISASFGIRTFSIPYFGIFGACSTFVEGMILSSILTSSGVAKNALFATSSHFCSAEKQFRFPLELGNQRPPTSQWTVTGRCFCSCCIRRKRPLYNSCHSSVELSIWV